jgi:hypothetical protein
MNAQREKLLRLVEELSEEEMPVAQSGAAPGHGPGSVLARAESPMRQLVWRNCSKMASTARPEPGLLPLASLTTGKTELHGSFAGCQLSG